MARGHLQFTGQLDPGYVGSEVTVGVRPQQIRMVPAEGKATIAAEVKVVEFRGERTIVTLELADINKTRVKVDVPASMKKQRGEICWLEFAPEIKFITWREVTWDAVAAAATILVIPVIIFTFLVQKCLVRGLTMGAVRG